MKILLLCVFVVINYASIGTFPVVVVEASNSIAQVSQSHDQVLASIAPFQSSISTAVASTESFTTSSQLDLDVDLEDVSPQDVFGELNIPEGLGGGGGGGYYYQEYRSFAEPTIVESDLSYPHVRSLPSLEYATVTVCGYDKDEQVMVTLRDPSGSAVFSFEEMVTPWLDYDTGLVSDFCYETSRFGDYEFLPGEPLGTYSIEFIGQNSRVVYIFRLEAPSEPLMYYSERMKAHVLTGYAPSEKLKVVLYIQIATGQYKPMKAGQLTLDEHGNGILVNGGTQVLYLFREDNQKTVQPLDYNRLINLDPNEAFYYYGRERTSSSPDPFDDLARAIELDPEFALAYTARGEMYEVQSHFDLAIKDYSKAIEFDPSVLDAYLKRARLYEWLQQYEKALADYDIAIEFKDANLGALYVARARIYRQLGDRENELANLMLAINLEDISYWESNVFIMSEINIEELDRAIELEPRFERAYYLRGLAHMQSWELELAIADFRHVIELNPTNQPAYERKASLLAEQGNQQEAIADYTSALNLNPSSLTARIRRAQLYEVQERYTEAIADYSAVIGQFPHILIPRFNRGQLYALQGEYDRSLNDYGNIIELEPNTTCLVFYGRARLYDKLGEYSRALADFRKATELDEGFLSNVTVGDYTRAIELDPSLARAYYLRGLALRMQDNELAALSDFSRAIDLDPDFLEAYSHRANIYDSLGELDAAITDYTTLIQEESDTDTRKSYLWLRARLYIDQGMRFLAISDYTLMIAEGDSASLSSRAQLFEEVGEYEKAIADWTALLNDSSYDRAFIYYPRSHLYGQLNNTDLALADLIKAIKADSSEWPQGTIDDFSRAIDADPSFGRAYYLRGATYESLGEMNKAISDYDMAIELGLDDSSVYIDRAEAYRKLGAVEQATADYNMLIQRSPNQRDPYLGRASLHFEQGDFGAALSDYTYARTLGSEVEFATWVKICLNGTMLGRVDTVLNACDQAALLSYYQSISASNFDGNQDTVAAYFARGFARAFAGTYSDAARDLRFVQTLLVIDDTMQTDIDLQQLSQLVATWLIELDAGRNPFTLGLPAEVLPLLQPFFPSVG